MHLSAEHQRVLLDVARGAICRALRTTATPPPTPPADPHLQQLAGCFVSLHETCTHRLRGCVGRLDARAALSETVAAMARAVLDDPRFVTGPVTHDELPLLDIELSILSPLRPAQSPLEFEAVHDGIYLTHGDRSGCFLPQVARETGWSKQQLLERLCTEKMGLTADTWRHPASRLFRFATLQIGPEPFVERV
jgi:AmmeMemoRadiSam system protein A